MDATRETLGILVVGAGFLGTQRAAASRAARGTTLIGVVDTNLDRARAATARFGGFAVANLEEGLALEGVDAVVVATPHADHVDSVEFALARGKHVLCEKPLAIDADQAWRLAHQADDARVRLATGFNHRFYPPLRDALAIVSGWGVGRVEGVRARIGHLASSEFLASWHGDFEQSGGGTLLDNGPHACDLIRRFLGEVEAACGTLRHDPNGPPGCEREAFGLFRNYERAIGELHSSWSLRTGYLTVEVRGASGWMVVETAPWRLRGQLADGRRIDRHYLAEKLIERLYRRQYGCERSLALELESFADTVAGRPAAGANGWDGCRAVEMVQAVYESDRRGVEVSLAPPRSVPAPPVEPKQSVTRTQGK
jgi:predicted dehydrogenase